MTTVAQNSDECNMLTKNATYTMMHGMTNVDIEHLRSIYEEVKEESVWDTFETFTFDMGRRYMMHVSRHGLNDTVLSRINPNGKYSKKNCRWSTKTEGTDERKNMQYKKMYLSELRRSVMHWLSEDIQLTNEEIAFILNIDKSNVSRLLKRGGTVSGRALRLLNRLYNES